MERKLVKLLSVYMYKKSEVEADESIYDRNKEFLIEALFNPDKVLNITDVVEVDDFGQAYVRKGYCEIIDVVNTVHTILGSKDYVAQRLGFEVSDGYAGENLDAILANVKGIHLTE